MTVNFAQLKQPELLQIPSYNTLVAEYQELVKKKVPKWKPLASDQIQMLLEAFAYRELHLRQSFNQKARGLMLPYASGTDLDTLATLYNITRLSVETDKKLRQRIIKSLASYSTAGSQAAYEYHVLNSDASISQVNIYSPHGGHVTVIITTSDNIVSQTLINKVKLAVSNEKVRPITDTVFVVAATVKIFDISANLTLSSVGIASTVDTTIKKAFDSIWKIGQSLSLSHIYKLCHIEGVKKVVLSAPSGDINCAPNQLLKAGTISLSYT